MKKNYEKPIFLFHDFEVSHNISAGCELISNHAENVCAIYTKEPGWEDVSVFAIEGGCMTPPANGDDKPCYHIPSETYNVFTS